MFNAILFDLDGTICNTNDLIIASLRNVFSETSSKSDDIDILKYWGKPLKYQLKTFLPGRNDYDDLADIYRDYYRKNQSHLLKEFDGIHDMLIRLNSDDKIVGIVTNKLTEIAKETLDALNYSQYFKIVVGCDMVENVKPNPEPILKAMELLKLSKINTIYIGDNVDDVTAAKLSEISSGIVDWTLADKKVLQNTLPDFFFKTPCDILSSVK